MNRRTIFVASVVSLILVSAARAETADAGQVELPLAVYDQLVETARDPAQPERPAPARFALGSSQVEITATAAGPRPSGEVRVTLSAEVLEDGWVLIPLLPAGTAVESVTVDGEAVQLITAPAGLGWAAQAKGTYAVELRYRLDAARSPSGLTLAVPVPAASAITLAATLPGTGLDVAVIPSAGTRATAVGATTRVTATVPTTRGIQLSWRVPEGLGHSVSRARYRGQLSGDAVSWSGELTVELISDETVTLPLLPSTVTLKDLRIDGRAAPILSRDGRLATVVRGRGAHTLAIGFEVPVLRRDGPPRVELEVPEVPVSRFELTLPGKKDVTVSPAPSVELRQRGGNTVATAHVPLSSAVTLSWAESVPEEIRAEVRANAGIYHAVRAEEGVLYVDAVAEVEVTRGETHQLRLAVPAVAQVERVWSPSGAVADWRLAEAAGGSRELTVFLDRQLRGRLVIEVGYDVSIDAGEDGGAVEVPLLRAVDAQRQRGMVALLAGQDLALEPVVEEGATRVGENQLPAFVRQTLDLTVGHTFKYVEAPPRLAVTAAPPERRDGRFDATVDTLISVGEVTLKGSASVEIDVKSGGVTELELVLPAGASLLSLSGPSVRQHKPGSPGGDAGRAAGSIAVDFTQEMTGQFRLELAYERLLPAAEAELEAPVLEVPGAEVERGRLAVEALTAVEVRPATVERLTSLDTGELPKQLILRTTNPILHAYKYVGRPHRLTLAVDRHEVVPVHEAAIDRAEVRTLITRDGLSVTMARYAVRNSRQQFLRVKLPEGSAIWSAFVDGRSEKPARTVDEDGTEWHLIKIIHSTAGFPVDLVFETPTRAIRGLGNLAAVLPRPEILVTWTRWDVFVPADVHYGEPGGDLELVAPSDLIAAADVPAEIARFGSSLAGQAIEPLRSMIPSAGVHFAFEKLYANQRGSDSGFEIPYASGLGRGLGRLLTSAAAVMFWLGLALVLRRDRRLGGALMVSGAVLSAVLLGHYRLGAGPALWLTALLLLAFGAFHGKEAWTRRDERLEEA